MKTIIFHIGLPKTGSSALQVFLAKNRSGLLSKSFDYFSIGEFSSGVAGNITSGNGALVARCLLPDIHPAKIAGHPEQIRALIAAVATSKSQVGILSSELLVEADAALLSNLIVKLKEMGVDSKIVYLLRDQSQILSSIYIQQVKRHGCIESSSEFIMNNFKSIGFLKYNSYYNAMAKVVGVENVHVGLYEEALRKEGIFKHFLRTIGAEFLGLDFAVQDINTSLSPKELRLMLLLNRFQPRMQFSDFVVENSTKFGLSKSGGIHDLLSVDEMDGIRRHFQSENSNLSNRLFGGVDIFGKKVSSGNDTVRSDTIITNEDLVAFFGGLLVRYDWRLANLEAQLTSLREELKPVDKR